MVSYFATHCAKSKNTRFRPFKTEIFKILSIMVYAHFCALFGLLSLHTFARQGFETWKNAGNIKLMIWVVYRFFKFRKEASLSEEVINYAELCQNNHGQKTCPPPPTIPNARKIRTIVWGVKGQVPKSTSSLKI